MNDDDRLSQALKSLPREQASLGFTAGVLRRLEKASPWWSPARWLPMPWSPMRWTTVAAAAVLVLALGFGWRQWDHRQEAAKLQVLLAEKQELEEELEALRRLAAEAKPTVYLGGDGDVDLFLDLARFKRQGGFGSGPRATLPSENPNRPAVAAAGSLARRGPGEEQTVRPLRVVY